ncbi:MAG: tRNA pseudouridine(55) synthase TruB [Succinivibrio sp.]|nr:tRNA pseudouridine(55) synthase TruB [Succinivibrio sp.]
MNKKVAAPRREVHGVLMLDKQRGEQSTGALTRVRGIYRAQKAGHTGALDPLASGVLPICLGECAKFSTYFLAGRKRYIAEGELGVVTATADAEGEVLSRSEPGECYKRIPELLPSFTGLITQVPPVYSAVKVRGKPLYRYARRGQEVEVPSRQVEIYELKLLELTPTHFKVSVYCSKGTYIRSLIADIGQAAGCGAYVTLLHRTEVEGLPVDRGISLEQLQMLCDAREDQNDFSALDALLLSTKTMLRDLPRLYVGKSDALKILHGLRRPAQEAVLQCEHCSLKSEEPLALWCGEELIGVVRLQHGLITPERLRSEELLKLPE